MATAFESGFSEMARRGIVPDGKLVLVPSDRIATLTEGLPQYVTVAGGGYQLRVIADWDGKVRISRELFDGAFEVAGLERLPVSVDAYNDFINDCCLNIPESYEATEGSAESIIVRYIRDLEQVRVSAIAALTSLAAQLDEAGLRPRSLPDESFLVVGTRGTEENQ